ncbi:TonB-linked SusC/RagA family outer membrane protein [Chitinophaga terrae (ex Kim and Jung 2007)]|uniref:SusC/RagA family TonB-linked outer membrane protein n=1 Tax=Chitinophaga terrae (ex Kim and Jung 2007) TaxID=408074 RepID=UPI002789CC38|nr:SusC/RagA family TonB-linked outer membrane protein [Chitinophaga terrae (ex Kim and Jung 2007)]MDQ0106891.1 TonB-linked SusC/RagA family outer membrane protein [Chitinophaga terrae (ex Kim and Jung 2007)]
MNLLFIPERSGKGAVFHRKRLPDTTRLMNKVLLLLLLSLQVSAVSFGQQVSLNLHNAPVEQFFREIKKQTGYGFFYDEALPKQIGNISVTVNNVALQTALTEGFKDRPVDWRIVNKSIYLGLKNAPSSQNLAAVSGRVLDPEGAALPLATVKITPLGKGAVTDENGNFTIAQVPAGKYTIEVTSIGFQPYRSTLEVAGQDKNLGNLQLSIAVNELNEIAVVNTGYQSLSRERAAGSFGVLNTATLEKRNNYSLINYLQGQVPGLLVGSDGRMTIRGQSTFLADRSPLLVIDGFAVERDINTINPNDVESITVLKDASAASIWGVRASNGVIVIQTKRGAASRKPLDISFSTSLAYRTKPSLSDIPFASTGSFMDFEKYKVDNKLTTLYGKPRNAISPVADAWLNNPANAARIVDSLKQYHGLNEFSDLFMQSTLRQQYSLSLAAKGEKSSTRGSFSYDNVPSYMKNTGNERFSADLFQSTALTKKLHLDMGVNFVMSNFNNSGLTLDALNNLLPYQQLLDANGNYVPQPRTFYQADKDALYQSGYPYNWNYNLLQEFRNTNNKTQNRNVTAIAGITYLLSKGFSISSNYQYENYNSTNTVLENEETYDVRNQVNFSTYVKNGQMTTGLPKGSIFSIAEAHLQSHTLRNQLKFDGTIGNSDHELTAIAGFEIREVRGKSSSQTKYGYDPNTLQYANLDYVNGYTNILGTKSYIRDATVFADTTNRYVSIYSNAGYTYKDKYSLNASARLDKTNLFGSSDKYKNVWLWSAGVSWQLQKEDFMMNSPFSVLILRATYGINGNVDRSTSPFLIAKVAKDQQTNLNYGYISNPANPLLRWEKTTVKNIGIDYVLLNNRLRGSIEYYNRYSTDLLGNATINGTYGFNSAYINYASMRNSGVDARISAVLLKRKLNISTTLNYSYNKNEVVSVDFPNPTVGAYTAGLAQAGKPLNYLYSYRWAGLSSTGAPQVYNEKNEAVDYTKEMTSIAALVYQGTTVPPHYGGWYFDFGYKAFSLTAGFAYNFGHRFRIPQLQYAKLFEQVSEIHKDWDKRWQKAGDEQFTNVPAMPASQSGLSVFDNYIRYADIHVATASNIRFNELILSYQVPSIISGRIKAERITTSLQARNLGVFLFNKEKIDPDYASDLSTSNILLAPPAEFTFSIKANF